MFKMIPLTVSTLVLLCCSLIPAQAARQPVWYGENQSGSKLGQRVESEVLWVTRGGARNLQLRAAQKAIGKGTNPPVAVAAAVLGFPGGVQIDSLGFLYKKLRIGTFFDETTDPIVRVEYTTKGQPNQVRYKTLSWTVNGVGATFNNQKLIDQGLPPDTTYISRFAIIAKPKVNQFVDDYGGLEVDQLSYHEFLNKDKNTQFPVVDLKIFTDGGGAGVVSDELLNGASGPKRVAAPM